LTWNDNCLEEFSGIFSCTDMKFKDMINVIMGKEILQFTVTEVNKNCGGKFTSDKY